MPQHHRTMRFEAWAAGSHKLVESTGCVIDLSAGLSGITVAEQGRGESSRLDVLASVAQD
jgi:hypothetical protein